MHYRAFRNILADWVSNHPLREYMILINLVLDRLIEIIGSREHKNVCWVFSRLGLGREDIVQKLLDFALATDDISGDDTLSALTTVNLTLDQQAKILDELHSRATKRYNNPLCWSIARLKNYASLPIIFNEWLRPDKLAEKRVDVSLVFTSIREIADGYDRNSDLIDEIWESCRKVVERSPKELYWDFDIGNGIVALNSKYVIPTVMHWHGQHGGDWFKNPILGTLFITRSPGKVYQASTAPWLASNQYS